MITKLHQKTPHLLHRISQTLLLTLPWLLFSQSVQAIPLFARQTGMKCTACHTVFPELNGFGRSFKLRGYTLTESELDFGGDESDKTERRPIPIAGMLLLSLSKTNSKDATGQNELTKDGKVALQQASLFTGGRIMSNLGAFIQATYEGIDQSGSDTNDFHMDMVDIRYAARQKAGNNDITYGLTLNNNPTAQDVWNSTPAWGYPYTSSSVTPGPAAATMIEGTLAQQVVGLGAYTLWNDWLYAELSAYYKGEGGLRIFTTGKAISAKIDGFAPYWRLALQHDWNSHYFAIGTYGMTAKIYPDPTLSSGPTNQFRDLALDAQYQFAKDDHIITATATWIDEKQTWDADFPAGATANASDTLKTFRIKGSYYYKHLVGGTLGYFARSGSTDTGLYAPGALGGSNTGKPDSDGLTVELTVMPWQTSRLGVLYTHYNKFNGSTDNYDGSGRKASDNDSWYLYTWLMF